METNEIKRSREGIYSLSEFIGGLWLTGLLVNDESPFKIILILSTFIDLGVTAPFNNMQTQIQRSTDKIMRFSLPSIKCAVAPPSFRLLLSTQ